MSIFANIPHNIYLAISGGKIGGHRQSRGVIFPGLSFSKSWPLTTLFNNCLTQARYPDVWKQEWVTPAPKVTYPKDISDLRKISCTSDYSKLFESFLKDWVMEEISKNIDLGQFGGQPGVGTEHMIVCLLDRVLKLLDRYWLAECLWSAGPNPWH